MDYIHTYISPLGKIILASDGENMEKLQLTEKLLQELQKIWVAKRCLLKQLAGQFRIIQLLLLFHAIVWLELMEVSRDMQAESSENKSY